MARLARALAVSAAVTATTAAIAHAQQFPSRPIRVLVTFSAGGQADILARMMGEKIAPVLGQPLVIENRPGAGGNIAGEAAVKSAHDGYTLLFGTPALAINGTLYRKMAFDSLKDIVPVTLMASGPYVLYVTGGLPAKDVAELIALAKAKPRELNYGSVGVGSGTHLVGVLFSLAAGTEMTHIPYKGMAQILPDMASGQVHMTFNAIGPAATFMAAGTVRLLATTASKRLAAHPTLPTVAESGLPGFEALGWYGFHAPSGVPREVLTRLNTEFVKVLNTPDMVQRIEKLGLFPHPQTLDEAARFLANEADKWGRAVKASGATAD
jgi:tripartite-type tricarboxylate transporter receptor subunit TctC